MDEVSMLTAITLFLLSAGNELVGVTVLQSGCINSFQNALNASDPWVHVSHRNTIENVTLQKVQTFLRIFEQKGLISTHNTSSHLK